MTSGMNSGKHPSRHGHTTLGDVLRYPEAFMWSDALYALPGAVLTAALPVLVWDVDDVDDDTDLPVEATSLGYDYVLSIQDVQAIIANTRDQRPTATIDDLLVGVKHYIDTDAFVPWD